MSAAAVSPQAVDPTPAAVDTPVVDPTPAAVSPPAVDPTPAAEPKATPTEMLKKFVQEKIPKYKKIEESQSQSHYTPKQQEKTQSDDDKDFKAQQEEKKKQIDDKIKKIIEDADVQYKALSEEYKKAKETYNNVRTRENEEKLDKISAAIDAVYADTSTELNKIQKDLNGNTTPLPVQAVQSLFNFVLNKIQAAFKKSQLNAQALHVSEDTMDILVKKADEMNQNIKEGEEVNMANMEAILNLAKKIADQNAPPPTSSPGPSLLGNAASAAAAALGKGEIPGAPGGPGVDAAAAALGKGKIPGEEKEPEEKEPEEKEPEEEEQDTAPEEEEQGGGGISRKRSHPKYINQISENRNKIFKKELEIINSIRRFHRSHTIRKRDKISSILGFKKSRNNRNRNHGNTKRHHHKHRHNNHKHKSTKHIKK
jgi:hypothetical protein